MSRLFQLCPVQSCLILFILYNSVQILSFFSICPYSSNPGQFCPKLLSLVKSVQIQSSSILLSSFSYLITTPILSTSFSTCPCLYSLILTIYTVFLFCFKNHKIFFNTGTIGQKEYVQRLCVQPFLLGAFFPGIDQQFFGCTKLKQPGGDEVRKEHFLFD